MTAYFPADRAVRSLLARLSVLLPLALAGCYHPHIINDEDAVYCEKQGLPRGTNGNVECAKQREAEEEAAGIHHPEPEPAEAPVAPQALPPPAHPGGVAQITDVTVAPGGTVTIGFFFSLNADCSADNPPELRIDKPPAHGTTKVLQRVDFPRFVQDKMPARCAPKRIAGVVLAYTASGNFDGKDSLEFETIDKLGVTTRYKVPIVIQTPQPDDDS